MKRSFQKNKMKTIILYLFLILLLSVQPAILFGAGKKKFVMKDKTIFFYKLLSNQLSH